jgi:hypothetical protein
MSEDSAAKLAYRNPLNDIPDQHLFVGLFAVGALSIFTLKAMGFPQWLVTLAPCFLMGVYAIVALATKRYRIREDKIGDNIYYLGFLFTLVSLAYALWKYDPGGAGASDIITNFGIAIATTIIGLAGRVFFNQMREDPIEYEREARFSLAESANALRAQLGDIAMEMSIFKNKLFQIMEEGVTDVSQSATSSMEKNAEVFAKTGTEVIDNVRTAFSTFTEHSSQLNAIASKNVAALEALFNRIENIEASPGLLASKLDPVMQKFEEAADEAAKRNRATANEIKRVQTIIETALNAAEALKKTVEGADANLMQKVDTLGKGLEGALSGTAGVADALASSARSLSVEMGGARDELGRVRIAVAAEVAAAGQALGEFRGVMESHRQVVADVRSTVEKDLALTNEHRDSMRKMATDSAEAVQQLEGALVSLAHAVTEKVSGPRT